MTCRCCCGFPHDVVALLDCSFECPYRNRIEIVGTAGALEFPEGVLPRPEIGTDFSAWRVGRHDPLSGQRPIRGADRVFLRERGGRPTCSPRPKTVWQT